FRGAEIPFLERAVRFEGAEPLAVGGRHGDRDRAHVPAERVDRRTIPHAECANHVTDPADELLPVRGEEPAILSRHPGTGTEGYVGTVQRAQNSPGARIDERPYEALCTVGARAQDMGHRDKRSVGTEERCSRNADRFYRNAAKGSSALFRED